MKTGSLRISRKTRRKRSLGREQTTGFRLNLRTEYTWVSVHNFNERPNRHTGVLTFIELPTMTLINRSVGVVDATSTVYRELFINLSHQVRGPD